MDHFSGGTPAPVALRLATQASLTVPDAARLQPYADQLLLLRALEARRATAAAELARLRQMSADELARAFPARQPDHDAEALQRDLTRLSGAAEDYLTLTRLTDAQRGRLFPPQAPADVYDHAAFAAAQRRALVRARDHDTLSNLTAERRAALYPPKAAGTGHDATAYQAALNQAQTQLTLAETELQAAQQKAEALRYALTGGAAFSALEAEYLAAYLAG